MEDSCDLTSSRVKFVIGVVLAGCVVFFAFKTGLIGRLSGLYGEAVKPPIRIEFRQSAQFWKKQKEYVMSLSNMDAQKGLEFIIIRDGKQDKPYRKYLSPGENNKEFGEMQIGCNFKSGDTGHVKVVGYDLAIRYDLSKMDTTGEFTCGYEHIDDRPVGR